MTITSSLSSSFFPLLVELICLSLSGSRANNFARANQAAANGKLQDAIRAYEEIVASNPQASGAWYNLGNTAFEANEIGKSVAALRTAQSLAPRDMRITRNLERVRRSVDERWDPPAEPAFLHSVFFWHFRLSVAELGWLLTSVGTLGWFSVWWLGRMRDNAHSSVTGWILVGILTVTFGTSWLIRTLRPRAIAVVKRNGASVRVGTDRRSDVRFLTREGHELRWKQIEGTWVQVERSDGEGGWIPRDDVYLLSL